MLSRGLEGFRRKPSSNIVAYSPTAGDYFPRPFKNIGLIIILGMFNRVIKIKG